MTTLLDGASIKVKNSNGNAEIGQEGGSVVVRADYQYTGLVSASKDNGSVNVNVNEATNDLVVVASPTEDTNTYNISTASGNDIIEVKSGSIGTIDSSNDNDIIIISGGTVDSINTGSGNDILQADGLNGTTISNYGGNDIINIKNSASVTINGGAAADVINISGENGTQNTVYGNGGNDIITVKGGTGHTLVGGAGNDKYVLTNLVNGGSYIIDQTGAGTKDRDTLSLAGYKAVNAQGQNNYTLEFVDGNTIMHYNDGTTSADITIANNATNPLSTVIFADKTLRKADLLEPVAPTEPEDTFIAANTTTTWASSELSNKVVLQGYGIKLTVNGYNNDTVIDITSLNSHDSNYDFDRVGQNLVMTVKGANEGESSTITFENYFNGSNRPHIVDDEMNGIVFAGTDAADSFNADDNFNRGNNAVVYLAGAGDDTITASTDGYYLKGEAGNDSFNISNSDRNTIDGGTGSDIYNITWTNGNHLTIEDSVVNAGDAETINILNKNFADFTFEQLSTGQLLVKDGNGGYLEIIFGNDTVNAANFKGITFQDGLKTVEDMFAPPSEVKTVVIDDGSNKGDYYLGHADSGDLDGYSVTLRNGTAHNLYAAFDERGLTEPPEDVDFSALPSVNATNNSVTVETGGTVCRNEAEDEDGDAKAAYVVKGTATKNIATLAGGTVVDIIGAQVEFGSASNNKAVIQSGSARCAFGAEGYGSDITYNSVELKGGNIDVAYGGATANGVLTNNSVNVTGGTAYAVYGAWGEGEDDWSEGDGMTYAANANSNSVTVSGGIINDAAVGGRASGSGDALSNKVNISGGTMNATVIGGRTHNEGDANQNELTISGGTIKSVVMGGNASSGTNSGTASSNIVTITGGDFSAANNIFGGNAASNNANANKVTITGASEVPIVIGKDILGGYTTFNGNANNNIVNLENVNITNNYQIDSNNDNGGYVYGGRVKGSGNANENEVTLNSGIVLVLRGGRADNGYADGNKVTVNGGTIDLKDYGDNYSVGCIDGGISDNGTAQNNIVTVNEGTINGQIRGGRTKTGTVINNQVVIKGGTINTSVLGARTDAVKDENNNVINNATVSSNSVIISGGAFSGSVYGGRNQGIGYANSNSIEITGGTFTSNNVRIYAGHADFGNANGNSIEITNANIAANRTLASNGTGVAIAGGMASGSGSTTANNNTVRISGGTVYDVVGGSTYGAEASGNIVTLSGGVEVIANVVGGWANSSNNGVANDNIVNINNANITGFVESEDNGGLVSGGRGYIAANGNKVNMTDGNVYVIRGGVASAENAIVENNKVTITGGTIYSVQAGRADAGTASGNVVNISGGTVTGGIAGGRTKSGLASDNTVNLSGTAIVVGNVRANRVDEGCNGATGDGIVTVSDSAQVRGAIYGGAGVDTITISGGSVNSIDAGDGNDIITISGGSVGNITGGSGSDSYNITWSEGMTLTIDNRDNVFGDTDTLTITNKTKDDFDISFDDANNVLTLSEKNGTGSLTINLANNLDTEDNFSGITFGETFVGKGDLVAPVEVPTYHGTEADESINTTGYEVVFGGGGNDTIRITDNGNTIYTGSDREHPSDNKKDVIYGGLTYTDKGSGYGYSWGSSTPDVNDNIINGSDAADGDRILIFGSRNQINAGAGRDSIIVGNLSGEGNSIVHGDAGIDDITVREGNNHTVYGDGGSDSYTVYWADTNGTVINNTSAAEGDYDTLTINGVSAEELTYSYNADTDTLTMSNSGKTLSIVGWRDHSINGFTFTKGSTSETYTLEELREIANLGGADEPGVTPTEPVSMTQLEVIQSFMHTLDVGYKGGFEAVDEAVAACSNGLYSSLGSLIDNFIYDCLNNTGSYNSQEQKNFLLNYCGINMDNDDTGAISGLDAGGSIEKTAESVVPEIGFTEADYTYDESQYIILNKNDLTPKYSIANGATIYGYKVDNVTFYWSSDNFTRLQNAGYSLDKLQRFITGVINVWASPAMELVRESYNMALDDEGSTWTRLEDGSVAMQIVLQSQNNSTLAAIESSYTSSNGITLSTNGALVINAYKFPNGVTGENGDPQISSSGYLDRVIAHELVHAVMGANINGFGSLPVFLKEGLAELVHGVDDERGYELKHFMTNINYSGSITSSYNDTDQTDVTDMDLKGLLHYIFNTYNANNGKSNNNAYAGGYMLLRYLAKQVADYSPNEGENIVINDGSFTKELNPAEASQGNISNNSVTLNNGTANNIFVAIDNRDEDDTTIDSVRVDADHNSVIVGENGRVFAATNDPNHEYAGNVRAAYVVNGSASENTVTLDGGTVEGEIIAAEIEKGMAFANTVNIKGGNARVVGGALGAQADTTHNIVNIKGGTISEDVYGGASVVGDVLGNKVNLTGGTIYGDVFGGKGTELWYESEQELNSNTQVTENKVVLNGSTVKLNVYGGYGLAGTVSNNEVELNKANLTQMIDRADHDEFNHVYGGYGEGTTKVKGNKVDFNNGATAYYITGGYSENGIATRNTVLINGGSALYIEPGVNQNQEDSGLIEGGCTVNGEASFNEVAMGYGTVNCDIVGGNAEGTGDAIHNYVRIQGGTVNGDIYGGYSEAGNATDSEITISGNAKVQDIYINATESGTTGNGKATVSNSATVTGTIYGGDGTDNININGGSVNIVSTGAGNDYITVNGGSTTTFDTGNGNDVIVVNAGRVGNIKAGAGDDIIGIDWAYTTGNMVIDQTNKGAGDNDILNLCNITADDITTTIQDGNTILTADGRTLTIKGDISIRYVESSELSFGDTSAVAASTDVSSMVDIFNEENKLKISGNQ